MKQTIYVVENDVIVYIEETVTKNEIEYTREINIIDCSEPIFKPKCEEDINDFHMIMN